MKEEKKGNQPVKEQAPVSKELKKQLLELIIHIREANEDMVSVWNGGKMIHTGSGHSIDQMKKKIASLLRSDELSARIDITSLLREIAGMNSSIEDDRKMVTKNVDLLEKIVQQL